MIAAVTGILSEVLDDRVLLSVGPFVLEVLVPASELASLAALVDTSGATAKGGNSSARNGSGGGGELNFHTLMYLEGESGGGNSEPRLLGFRSLPDKRFFEKFITVKGIGPKKALKALTMPTGQVASAIEAKDARTLSQLPGIGKRLAEQIIAELAGKVAPFATDPDSTRPAPCGPSRSRDEEDAILTLMTLGERRPDAESLLEKARPDAGPNPNTDTLVRTMLRLRGSGK